MEIKLTHELWGLLFWKEQRQIIYGTLMKIQILAKSSGIKYKGNLYRQILSTAVGEEVQTSIKALILQALRSITDGVFQDFFPEP